MKKKTAKKTAICKARNLQIPFGVYLLGPGRYAVAAYIENDKVICEDTLFVIVHPDGKQEQASVDF